MNIYLTLDYELYMGDHVGTVQKCLIEPTDILIRLFDRYNAKCTFFVDAAYLYQLNKVRVSYDNLNRDFLLIKKQLKHLVLCGHDIQLHIHPQWYYAEYTGKDWKLNTSFYKLSDLKKEEAIDFFLKSKLLLEAIVEKPIIAFRAGGYSIQTLEYLQELFSKTGVIIDSSVLSMKKANGPCQVYDYSNIDSGKEYFFNYDVTIPIKTGVFMEMPITTVKNSLFKYVINYIKYKLIKPCNKITYGDGAAVSNHFFSNRKKNWLAKICRIWEYSKENVVASLDNGKSMYLMDIYHKQKKEKFIVIIGHPKNLSRVSLIDTEKFLKETYSECKYDVFSSLNIEA